MNNPVINDLTPGKSRIAEDKVYGYDCLIPETKRTPYIWHNEFIKGHNSYIRLYPSMKIRIQILRNSSAHTGEAPDELNTGDVCSDKAQIMGI